MQQREKQKLGRSTDTFIWHEMVITWYGEGMAYYSFKCHTFSMVLRNEDTRLCSLYNFEKIGGFPRLWNKTNKVIFPWLVLLPSLTSTGALAELPVNWPYFHRLTEMDHVTQNYLVW